MRVTCPHLALALTTYDMSRSFGISERMARVQASIRLAQATGAALKLASATLDTAIRLRANIPTRSLLAAF